MRTFKYKISALLLVAGIAGCTKLHETLNNSFTAAQTTAGLGAAGTGLLLSAAYVDLGTPFTGLFLRVVVTGTITGSGGYCTTIPGMRTMVRSFRYSTT